MVHVNANALVQVDVPGLQRQFNDNRQQVVEARSQRDTMTGALNTVRDNVAIARRCAGWTHT